MVKKIIFACLVVLFLFQIIAAIETPVKIKTAPSCDLFISILNPSTNTSLGALQKSSNKYGDLNFTINSDASNFNLKVILSKDDIVLYTKVFENNYSAGKDVYLEISVPGLALVPTPNNTLNNTNITNTTNATINAPNATNLTNNSIINSTNSTNNSLNSNLFNSTNPNQTQDRIKLNNLISKQTSYIIIVLVGLIILFILVKALIPRQREIKIVKLSDKLREAYSH